MSAELPGPDPVAQLLRRVVNAFRGRFSRTERVIFAALGLIAVQLLFRAWASYGSWFMWDDYIFLSDVARGEDGWGWLFHSHFNLFMPVSFVLVKVVGGSDGFNWSIIATQMLVLQAVASLACWWMLRKLFGDNPKILFALAFYLFSPLTMPAAVWWSVSINQLPHHIAIFGAITTHVAYVRSGKMRYAVYATLFLTLGLGSYVKAPLIPVVLAGLTLCYFCSGSLIMRLRTFLSFWPAWVMYGSTVIGYAVVWVNQQTAYAPRNSCELGGVINNSLLETIGSTAVGGPWRWELWTGGPDPFLAASNCVPYAYRGDPAFLVGGAPQSLLSPPLWGLVAAWIAIAATCFYLWSRYEHALRALLFIVPYMLLSALFVFAGRAGVWGSQISALEVRYFSDVAAVMALGIGTMLIPMRGAKVRRRPRDEPPLKVVLPRRVAPILLSLFLVGSLVSSVTYVAPWHSKNNETEFPERAFVANVMRQLADERVMTPDLQIADAALPFKVALPTLYPDNLPSRKLAPLASQLNTTTFGTDLKILDDKGNIRDAVIPDPARTERGPVKDCGFLVQQSDESIPIVAVVDLSWWISVDYLASEDGTVRVQAGKTTQNVKVKSGLHTLFLQTSGGFSRVEMKAPQGLSVCVDNIRVGFPQAKGGAPAS